jgi:hypothetical protein
MTRRRAIPARSSRLVLDHVTSSSSCLWLPRFSGIAPALWLVRPGLWEHQGHGVGPASDGHVPRGSGGRRRPRARCSTGRARRRPSGQVGMVERHRQAQIEPFGCLFGQGPGYIPAPMWRDADGPERVSVSWGKPQVARAMARVHDNGRGGCPRVPSRVPGARRPASRTRWRSWRPGAHRSTRPGSDQFVTLGGLMMNRPDEGVCLVVDTLLKTQRCLDRDSSKGDFQTGDDRSNAARPQNP